ncbi:MAG: hypothetical protein KGI00_04345, partial [Candidatus Micrarchaeota archaeon]|nr:hypothetical protein [Candidatus Micrarchaeota archaeon]
WIYPVGLAGSTWYTVTDNIWGVQHGGWQIILQPTLMRCSPSNSTGYDPAQVTTTFSNNTWYFIVCRFNNTKIMEYKNNNLVGSMSITHTIQNPTQNTFIGSSDNLGNPTSTFSGYIANLQIYNTSLDNASITSLYREGIGGSPIDLQHLVAWWPLNGNANDYSGYNNNGNATKAVAWSANWQPGYTAPST